MHRPSRETLEADYHFSNGLINSYGKEFFLDFKRKTFTHATAYNYRNI